MSDERKQARVKVYFRKNPCNYCDAWKYDEKQTMYYNSLITPCCFDVPSTKDIDWLLKAGGIIFSSGIIIGGLISSEYFFVFFIAHIILYLFATVYKKTTNTFRHKNESHGNGYRKGI